MPSSCKFACNLSPLNIGESVVATIDVDVDSLDRKTGSNTHTLENGIENG